ncbi:hypothetical protein niasHT_039311 [Heterodera trifolii]|uniref:Cytochrome P450 monooxygenase n=1 Tax=Heterodera trifolii TaxID=157864 RepID=A0ABD2J234_9BILA
MGFLVVFLIASLFAWLSAWISRKFLRISQLVNRIPGPSTLPLVGNLHQIRLKPDEFFEQVQGLAYMFGEKNGRIARAWLGPIPLAIIFGAEEVEPVLGSKKLLTKMFHYSFLSAWIGDGLLLSKPDKWRPRRKLLTPTFHYDILKDFVPVYNRHGTTLVQKMEKIAESGEFVDIFHTITLCTLDIICESALGVNIDAQRTIHSDYLDAVFAIKNIIFQRIVKPQFYPEFLFNIFGAGKEQKRCVQILHDFTNKAILARKKAMEEAGGIEKLVAKKVAEGGKGVR